MGENEKRRISQVEEQLSDLLKLSDTLHLKVDELVNYAKENTKVVNGMLNKIDENQDTLKLIVNEMVAERKQRKLEIDTINRRLDRLEKSEEVNKIQAALLPEIATDI